ncbi:MULTISPECIES: flagellar basal body rod protein FlgC [Agrobacterium]|uniref:Flagellar basal-body rod protein FlgC n=2 Tax=Agrobacterium rosae TaxID=1972867 RepID=A0AAE5VP56_9HYPH|nr:MULTISPECIES: flagellar basal body rod protein FlgC [Agrobacterium]KAA3514091.1 flagellar basal body rod protein FlgC [Agrobacterium rosae]KAA3522759.1 flagellar basal body rod protein FlgC [Agrobacterium rosae]MBN7807353.1 flagellar basal body rod protein FlgC [Agrobacterium rosae]MCM2433978.1 flagellar basal body rod protein FlgC [Agrobacterium rosae]MDX8302895.1 flagellar basal body rod protein FlgC [Agrobacterium rosae]
MDPLKSSMKIAGNGMEAQATRLRIVSENIANSRTTGDTPGADPYRRKTITFANELDRASQTNLVEVKKLGVDRSDFTQEYDPDSPAADEKGMVKLPNVNMLIEMADLREANRGYDANLQVIKQTRDMVASTIDLLKA